MALSDSLDAAFDRVGPDTRGSFTIENDSSADWALRKIAEAEGKLKEIKTLAEAEIKVITDWQIDETEKVDADIAFFRGLLTSYHFRRLKADEKAKTIQLPHGTLKSRKQPRNLKFVGHDFLRWAEKNAKELCRVTYAVDVAKAKEVLQEVDGKVYLDGTEVPGVEIIDECVNYYVDTDTRVGQVSAVPNKTKENES